MTAAAAQPNGRPWWLTVIMGIAAVVIGGILLLGSLTAQARTYLLLVQLVGIWWLIARSAIGKRSVTESALS